MTPPENDVLQAVAIVLFAICLAYAAGRMHQWYLQALERDQAWRHGYDLAARSLFHLATRVRPAPARRPEPSKADAVRATATVLHLGDTGRHAAVRAARTDRVTAPVRPATATAYDDVTTVTGLVQQRTPAG